MDTYLMLRFLLIFFELLAAATAIMYWNKVSESYWKWFVVYLVTIALSETIALYVGYQLQDKQLNAFINIYFNIPLQFIFFFWLFYKWFGQSNKKSWAMAGCAGYIFSVLFELFFLKGKQLWFFSFSYIVGNIFLLLLTILFFYGFILSDKVLHYRSSRMFWVCCGLLVFYMGSLPMFGLWNTLATNYPAVFNRYWMVVMNLNYLMYVSFAISFIWASRK